jgi:kynurenine 3-monooxygenase
MRNQPVNIVGAGLAGALLTTLLARRGFTVNVFEKRQDPRLTAAESGRSINLALASRGIRALERAGLMEQVYPILNAVRGRMVHELGRRPAFLPYGQRAHEVIYSAGRAALNRLLIEVAASYDNVHLRFGQACVGIDQANDRMRFRDIESDQQYDFPLAPTLAADGGGSAVRGSLAERGVIVEREELLDNDYKELTLPPVEGRYALDPNALHIWPRGGFMFIALPNPDLSFTATLFLAREGPTSFAALDNPQDVLSFFEQNFPDVVPLVPRLQEEFASHSQARLGTVHAEPWHIDGQVLLLGDAAHAMVPFHGQGMNAAFEDCAFVDELLDRHDDWSSLFESFEQQRRPHAAAISQMALENYIEMRDTVRDPAFARHKALALELERRFPDRFIPRYSMVMFHPEIPYGEALRRGAVQAEILRELDARPAADGGADFALAEKLLTERLPRLRA